METIELLNIPIDSIDITDRVRKDFNPAKMKELVDSIKEKGLISPITVERVDDTYILLAGERRLRACKELGMTTIPVRIYQNVTPLDMREIELYENLHRDNLTPAEEYESQLAIYELQVEKHGEKSSPTDTVGVSQRDVARLIGVSNTNFARDLEVARAMKVFPDLRNAKTKSEANQMLNKLKRQFKEHKAIEKVKEEKASDPRWDAKEALSNSYHLQDFFTGISSVAPGICDFVELDWPYGVDLKEVKKGEASIDEYNEVDAEVYPKFIRDTLTECYRVMKNNSWLICWFAPEPWFEVVYETAISIGFTGRRLCGEWIKPIGQTNRPDSYLANSSEWFFYFAKGRPALHKPGRSNLFHFSPVSPAKKCHPTERPVELIEEILDTFLWPGAVGLVPFLGSGNTILAAHNLNHRAWGYDLSKEYQTSYLARLAGWEGGKFKSLEG